MKISEVLERAAGLVGNDKFLPSCIAVERTDDADADAALRYLYELGVEDNGRAQFYEFDVVVTRQAARYCWLMFAAHIAREEGL